MLARYDKVKGTAGDPTERKAEYRLANAARKYYVAAETAVITS
jgi:hypothetical protein